METYRLLQQAAQLHHDYYVGKKRAGKMTEQDQVQYLLACKREKLEQVKPLNGISEEPDCRTLL